MKTSMATLTEFVWIWDKYQNLTLPKHHCQMCYFLSKVWTSKTKHALLMAFRDSGKSTVVGLFCAWLLYSNPDVRILIMSADFELAKKMVRNIKRIIEKHPLTRHLKPAQKDQWASDRFTVVRKKELRDPSVLARGIGANITGSRADVVICDDVEVPKTCDSPSKRMDLKEKLTELDFVLVPNGMMLYVGTPHTKQTIYDNSENGFLSGFSLMKLPVLDKNGKSVWEERFSVEKINAIKKRAGPLKFLSQMMLSPVELKESRLNVNLIRFYQEELNYQETNHTAVLKIGNKKMVSGSAWWDPSFGKSEGDRSVLACVFFDDEGNCYVHDMIYINVQDENNAAEEQCFNVSNAIERYHLPCVMIETNGIGKFLPELLKKTLKEKGIGCAVLPKISHIPKVRRILEALDARLSNGSIYMNERIKQTPFIQEMTDWNADAKNIHDDGLDALAGCLSAEPVRLKYNAKTATFLSWQQSRCFKILE